MSVIEIILIIVFFVYFKWILIAVVLPFQTLFVIYKKKNKSKFWKLMGCPILVLEKMMRGGYQRWMIFQVGNFPSLHVRKFIYKLLGVEMGSKVVFHFRTEIRAPHMLCLGKGTIIGDNAILDARSGLIIGKNVNLSSNVSIYTLQHDHRDSMFCSVGASVKIEDRVWIGSNVVVLPGVTIGEGAVCCAGCVVTKNVEPYTVVAGIPAKKVNERPHGLRYEFGGKSCRLY